MKIMAFFLFLTLMLSTFNCQASGGIEPVLVEDGLPRSCIDTKSGKFSLHIMRLVTEKKSALFSEDKEVAVSVTATINPPSQSGLVGTTISKLEKFKVSPYGSGTVAVPVRMPIFSNLEISSETSAISNIEFKFNIYAISKPTMFTRIITSLIQESKKISLPQNPYVQSFQQLTSVFDAILNTVVTEADDELRQNLGSDTYQFSEGEDCMGFYAQAGSKVFISGVKNPTQNQISLTDIDKYCFIADKSLGDRIVYFYERKNSRELCSKSHRPVKKLENPHIMVAVIASKSSSSVPKAIVSFPADSLNPPSITASLATMSVNDAAAIKDTYKIDAMKITGFLNDWNEPLKAYSTPNIVYSLTRLPEVEKRDASVINLSEGLGATLALTADAKINLERCKLYDIPLDECI